MASTRNSNIIKKLGRSSDGRINQDCHCCMHEHWASRKNNKIYDIKQGEKFQKPILEFMIKKNYITQHNNYLCTYCCKKGERLPPDLMSSSQKENEHGATTGSKSPSDSNVNTDNNKDQLDIYTIAGLLIDKLGNSSEETAVPYERWAKLISLIGFKTINPQVYKEGLELNMMYKDCQSLKNISFDHYICQRDKCLVAFLKSN